jgi:F-type H+-transporting ATPase subunit b
MPTHAVAAGNFLLPNATFIVELIAFVIILGLLWRYVLPPVQRAMSERQELIRTQLEESRQARERMQKAEEEYRRAVEQNREEIARIREDAHRQAQRVIEEARDHAREEATRVAQRAEQDLAAARERTFNDLRAEIGGLGVELASRIVGEALKQDARQRRLVDRFLAELAEGGPAGERDRSARSPERVS